MRMNVIFLLSRPARCGCNRLLSWQRRLLFRGGLCFLALLLLRVEMKLNCVLMRAKVAFNFFSGCVVEFAKF
jgi:hypothetical protein